ncbi:MAG: hypothetical protein Q8928_12135 [Bacteroidota bacterium]|nr:hypothetical protein [Bacteroidota bacterium]
MMKNLKAILLIVLVSMSVNSYSQIGITGYSINALGVNTTQNKPLSCELKVFANRGEFNNTFGEFDVFYNFKPGQYHRFSLGAGFRAMPFNSNNTQTAITIPAAIEIYPLKDFKKISVLFELAPEFYENSTNLRSLWGLRYTFGE